MIKLTNALHANESILFNLNNILYISLSHHKSSTVVQLRDNVQMQVVESVEEIEKLIELAKSKKIAIEN